MPVEYPTDPIGLPDVIITGASETWSRVTMTGEGFGRVLCPHCGKDDGLLDPVLWNPSRIADTPLRGRSVTIDLVQWRYRCSPCRKTFIPTPASIHGPRQMTHRLVRHIENLAPRRMKKAIADEIGVSTDRIDSVVNALAERVAAHHRFPTPTVLGIDDIKMNKKTYIIFTDAKTGRGVGFIEDATTDLIAAFIETELDLPRIKVVVSDMAQTILSVTKRDGFGHIVHVADQWHVLKGSRKAMSKLVAQHMRELNVAAKRAKKRKMPKSLNENLLLARRMRALRRQLLGRREDTDAGKPTSNDDGGLTEVFDRYPEIASAFRARLTLASAYSASSSGDAKARLDQFYAEAQESTVAELMAAAVKTIRKVEPYVLNAAHARLRLPEVAPAAFSTSSTERRNGTLRAAWRAGRGVTNFAYLRLLALYEPWYFDVDIVECAEQGCRAIEGPVGTVAGLLGQDRHGPILPAHEFRCVKHGRQPSATVCVA